MRTQILVDTIVMTYSNEGLNLWYLKNINFSRRSRIVLEKFNGMKRFGRIKYQLALCRPTCENPKMKHRPNRVFFSNST